MSLSVRLRRFIDDLNADLSAYRRLAQMFDAQFAAALRLDGGALTRAAEGIAHEVGLLDERRRMRGGVGHVQLDAARQAALRAQATAAQRTAIEARYAELEKAVKRCKAQAVRNGNLLASQFEMMQQLLYGEKHTYAPG